MVGWRRAAILRCASSEGVVGLSVPNGAVMIDLSPSHELAVSLRPPTRSHRNTSGTMPMTEMTT